MNSKKIYRNKMHILPLLINLAIIFVLKCPELHDNVVHIFTSRKELVFFYSNVFSGYYIIVNVTRHLLYAVTVLLVISWCYSHVPNKCGRILYNTALGTLAGALVVYMALSMIVARSFMRIFVPFILITILLVVLIVLNERFYRKNDDEAYRANKPLLRLIPLLLLYLLWIFIGAVYVVNRLPEEYESDYEFYLTYYESRLHGAIGSIEYISKNMAETNYMYVNVWFVNNFSKDGKEYNVEELAEEAYNLQTRNGKSWYRFQQFVDSYWEIQHSYDYDFEKYYFDNWNKTDIYSQIFVSGVSRRLENMGETLEDASREDVDSACEYVKNVIVSDEEIKPVEKISLEIVAPVPGEAPDYDITFESGNGYVASIYEWNRVSKVGVRNSIETLTPENGKVFEDDSVYCAEIHVIHDVDYTIDEYSVDADIHGESFSSYKVNDGIDDGDIIISVWYETGDPTSHGLVDSINIDSIGNISIGDSTVYDESMVRTDNENVVVTDVSWYCCKGSEEVYTYKETFSDEYEAYIVKFDIYSDTGHIISNDVKIKYDGINVMKEWGSAGSSCVTDFVLWPSNGAYTEARVSILYNRLRTEAENGSLTADCDYAYNGSKVKLTATPDDGYRFVKYVVKDNEGIEKNVEITDDVLTMPEYPVCITAVFEKE